MSSNFDWVVEYETLPPDDSPRTETRQPERRHGLKPWVWFSAALVAVALVVLYFLARLGDRSGPLPSPDRPQSRLEQIIDLEIAALTNGDREILDQLQDDPASRRHLVPPPDRWFSEEGGAEKAIELIAIQTIGENGAMAKVKLTWLGVAYRLFWFYRLDDNHWVHTDWQTANLGPASVLRTDHVEATYFAVDHSAVAAIAPRIEAYLAELCNLLPCPTEAFSATLDFHNYAIITPNPTVTSPLHYQVQAPFRDQWPDDGKPNLVVLGSLGRQLVYDLFVRSVQDLTRENRSALTLGCFWLAHHLLRLETLPGTIWLEEAAERDGLPAAVGFLTALAHGTPPQTALAAFRAESISRATSTADFFGWLVAIADPATSLEPSATVSGVPVAFGSSSLPRYAVRADPWAAPGQVYRQTAPAPVEVRSLKDWVLVRTGGSGGMPVDYVFMRMVDGTWLPGTPDQSLLGQRQAVETEFFSVSYWELDEPYVDDLVNLLTRVHHRTMQILKPPTVPKPAYVMLPSYGTAAAAAELAPGEVALPSPSLGEVAAGDNTYDYHYVSAAIAATSILEPILSRAATPDSPLAVGFVYWYWDYLLREVALESDASWGSLGSLGLFMGSASASAPMANLGISAGSIPSEEQAAAMFVQARLVVEFVVDRYGLDKVSTMADGFETAASMEDWVATVTGQQLEQFEADWRAWVAELAKEQ